MKKISCASNTRRRVQGCIDVIVGDTVYGWIYADEFPVLPLLFIDNRPAKRIGVNMPRPDVTNLSRNTVGFAFQLSRLHANSVLTLHGAVPQCVCLVDSLTVNLPVWENRFIAQLTRAADIARQKDAVAITCWDGAHNCIGRASTLYDIVSQKRPCVLFCYVGHSSGDHLWRPLLNDDLPIVTVPWGLRRCFRGLARDYGLSFNTVWICKPRLPSFLLAADISHEYTRCICDIDDDEEAFCHATSHAAYDLPGMHLAAHLLDDIRTRTAASTPLCERFGGILVRHARTSKAISSSPRTHVQSVQKIAFIGTAREHKNILEAVTVLRSLRETRSLEIHVLGDITPSSLRDALRSENVVLGDMISRRQLPAILSTMDAVITGFPLRKRNHPQEDAIVRAQVPAKIFDALAAGIPVLTPETPATADLQDVPGVYLFTQNNFACQVKNALAHTDPITLPPDCTLEGAYKAFATAEMRATPSRVLTSLLPSPHTPIALAPSSPALVLLWKQRDAGLYGRRVDQIARSYLRKYAHHRVYVLEFEHKNTISARTDHDENMCDEAGLLETMLIQKRKGCVVDGINYTVCSFDNAQELDDRLTRFFVDNRLTPTNTVIVVFPCMDDWNAISPHLSAFPVIVDVVDNQLSWATDGEKRVDVIGQYFTVLSTTGHVIFNSASNLRFFAGSRFLGQHASGHLIPNWYSLPEGVTAHREPLADGFFHLWYSGNMNDRIDWELLNKLVEKQDLRLHIAGTASRRQADLDRLLRNRTCIYHGVTTERETLALLSHMHATIVPHVHDNISRYMDPLKIHMFASYSLPILCPDYLSATKPVISYHDHHDCLKKIESLSISKSVTVQAPRPTTPDAHEAAYMTLIAHVRNNATARGM